MSVTIPTTTQYIDKDLYIIIKLAMEFFYKSKI